MASQYHFLFIKKEIQIKNLKFLKIKNWFKLIHEAVIIPKKLKLKGNHFINIGNNSASTKLELFGKIRIDDPQKLVPSPIKKSFVK